MVAHLLVDWYDSDADHCATVLAGGLEIVYRHLPLASHHTNGRHRKIVRVLLSPFTSAEVLSRTMDRVEVLCHKLIQQEQWLELHKVMQSGLGAAIRSVSRRQDLEPWDVADRAAAFIKSVTQT